MTFELGAIDQRHDSRRVSSWVRKMEWFRRLGRQVMRRVSGVAAGEGKRVYQGTATGLDSGGIRSSRVYADANGAGVSICIFSCVDPTYGKGGWRTGQSGVRNQAAPWRCRGIISADHSSETSRLP